MKATVRDSSAEQHNIYEHSGRPSNLRYARAPTRSASDAIIVSQLEQ